MKRFFPVMLCMLCVVFALPSSGCGGKKARKGENMVLHTNYGGCRIQGRHYHNTHVFLGDMYEPSLSEWLKY